MPPPRLDALIAIGTLIAPEAEARPAVELARAWNDPDDYADAHAGELEARGIDGPVDHLPWIALIELLAGARALVELDRESEAAGAEPGMESRAKSRTEHRADPGAEHGAQRAAPGAEPGAEIDAETLRRAIERLAGCPRGAFAWMKHDGELADRSTAELCELAGKALLARGVQLAQLGGDALGRCLVVVPEARAGELVKLARAAGYGEAVLFTGARLTKATKDRTAAARHAARQMSQGSQAAQASQVAAASRAPGPAGAGQRGASAVRYFARGKETWTVSTAGAELETCYEKPRVKYYVQHYFDDAAAARAGLLRQLAEWTAAGFREVDHAAFAALPHADTPYINWTAPFPDDASYVVEGKEIVRCTELRGETVVEAAGTIGYNFGERQRVYHCQSAAAAQKRYAQHVAADAHFPAISRAEVIKRYR
jgi:hypothetical protein